jgi:hypothetical protein
MSDKSQLVQRAEQVLLDMLNKAAEIGSAAVDEIPLVVQELLTWKFTESLLLFTLSMIFTISWIIISVKIWKYGSRPHEKYSGTNRDNWEEAWIGYGFYNFMGLVISVPWVIHSFDWLKILVAPRLYLLEYAAQLIK